MTAPVLDMDFVIEMIKMLDFVDEWKIGKLNYNPNLEAELRRDGYLRRSWGEFGREAEEVLKAAGKRYLIKESLRAEMEKT